MPPPLKILIVEPYAYAPAHRWVASRISAGLSRRGHEVTLVTFGEVPREAGGDPWPFSVRDVAKENHLARLLSGRAVARQQTGTGSGYRRLYCDLRTFPKALRMAAHQAYDFVYCYDWHPVTLWWMVRLFFPRKTREKTILAGTIHHLGRLARGRDAFLGLTVKYYRRALATLIKDYMQVVFVWDEGLRSDIITRLRLPPECHRKVVVIPHGMDTNEPPYGRAEARRRLGIDEDEKVLLLIGVLRRDKGIDVAIRAMEGTGSCRLYIVGAPYGCDVEELRGLIRACHGENSIVLEPRYFSEDRMRDYILASDALLLPYAKTFRGQSGVIARACQYARCVIASDVGAVGDTIRQYGFGLVVEPESPEKLRQAIEKFLGLSDGERLEMESKAKLAALSNSWDEVCRRIEEVYYRCSGRGSIR